MSLTIIIIIATVAISWFAWRDASLLNRLIMSPTRITVHKEYYRLLTSGFVHADQGHLIFNMLTLYFFGEAIERLLVGTFGQTMGWVCFLAFYLLGIIASDIPTYLKNRNNYGYAALGASGGVASLLFGYVLIAPLSDICLYYILCMPGFIFGLLYLGYSYIQAKRGTDNIGHDAHFYGSLFGLVFMAILIPSALPNFISQISSYSLF
jgi:membrane associated rhomboid family serine protease